MVLVLLSILCIGNATALQSLPTDIEEPSGIYYPWPPDLLRVDVQTRVGTGPCQSGNYNGCTLDDVNSDTNPHDDFKPEVKVHFTAPDFSDDGTLSNAGLRLRGESSRFDPIKSYRIKLDSRTHLWRGERRLQLNKHMGSDLTRVKNKLSFDLISTIANLPSLRTQFVQLFIDGQDYGLYTHVEYVGKEYLKLRKWDKNSPVYKANDFDFSPRSELALDAQGKPLNLKNFETVLEIKRGKDHRALQEMITAVNDESNDFKKDVLDKYFNLNNFLSWEAVLILMGNTDVTVYNYYLYNPKGSKLFYFLPWDFDLTWGYDWAPTTVAGGFVPPRRHQGPHNLWATVFGRRFLSQPGALDQLNQAVREIKDNYLTPAKIKQYTNTYYNVVYPLISSPPDVDNLDSNQPTEEAILNEYNQIYNGLADTVQKNYDRFLKIQNSPMPFDMNAPSIQQPNITFSWEEAVDLQGDPVTYDLEISDNLAFKPSDIKFSAKNLTQTSYTTDWMLPRGNYYYRITARDTRNPAENWQLSFEEIYDSATDISVHGVMAFSVSFDGTSTPPPQGGRISIDGDFKDWAGHTAYTDSTNDGTVVNWDKVWTDDDNGILSFSYANVSEIDKSQLYLWNIYLDTDNIKTTGYTFNVLGGDYLLQGKNLYEYTGAGQNWSWKFLGKTDYAATGNRAELSINKQQLGLSTSPSSYRALFYGTDTHGNNLDYLLINVSAGTASVIEQPVALAAS